MKNNYLQIIVVTLLSSMAVVGCSAPQSQQNSFPKEVTLSKSVLLDKIKGAWAGQTIGCTYGGPTEFKFRGTMIQDYNPIRWDEGCIKNYCLNGPGLYDDIYMDLTFVEVFDRLGLDAPVDSFAMAFANAGYVLWHANQAARYNILQGIMPPASGHWLNNPHANDLDYQIEALGILKLHFISPSAHWKRKVDCSLRAADGETLPRTFSYARKPAFLACIRQIGYPAFDQPRCQKE